MTDTQTFGDIAVSIGSTASDAFVATAEIRRPPNNFFDLDLIDDIASAFEALDGDSRCRAIVLCSEGKNFCAGAQLGRATERKDESPKAAKESGREPVLERDSSGRHLYDAAVRLFSTETPVVAAIQGAAVGGGFGLALMPDFRVAAPEARFTANFARLGFHHGFGLTVTLPDIVGRQRALELLYTGRRVKGEEALEIGLCDKLVSAEELRPAAIAFAREIAISGPLAVHSIRETMRGDLPERIREATNREQAVQDRLQKTNDFKEGVRAMAERRTPEFTGS